MKRLMIVVGVILAAATICSAQGKPLLLQKPTLSEKQIAFAFGGDFVGCKPCGWRSDALDDGHRR
jgi:hypothetical protein